MEILNGLAQGFSVAMLPINLMWCFVGVFLGTVVGILPGLAGLAQVAGDYYLTPHQKLRLDRIYIRHRSLGFDVKLLILAFLVAFWFRWQSGWNGRLPRRLIRFGGSTSTTGSTRRSVS